MKIAEVRMTLLLPRQLKKRLDRAARKRSLPTLGLIRLALNSWLDEQNPKEKLEREARKKG